MNKNKISQAAWLLLFFTCTFTSISIAAEKLVFTSVKGAYIQQISEAVLKAAYAKLEIDFETSWLPPKRAIMIASSGESDGEISRVNIVTKHHPDLIQIKIPVNHLEGMAITKNKTIHVDNWDSLRPYKIGVARGILFAEKGTKGMNVQLVNGFPALFQMLNKNRVDVIVAPREIALFQTIQQDLDGIIINEPPLTRLNQYHYLHKRHSKLATRLEAVLTKMQESGEIERIRSDFIKDKKLGIIRTSTD